jgi:hypothetical protein
MAYRLSIAERIALTSGFKTSSDSRVLAALASFAHFETGANACPSVQTLQARIPDISLRTIARSLARLEAEGWIAGRHVQRRPTVYRICLERLATSATMAKVVVDHDADLQIGTATLADKPPGTAILAAATLSIGTATLSIGTAKMADHPVLDPVLDPKEAALRAVSPPPTTTTKTDQGESRTPHQLAFGPEDVSDGYRPQRCRGGHSPPCGHWNECTARTLADARAERAQRERTGS